jgi:hypothetical protein
LAGGNIEVFSDASPKDAHQVIGMLADESGAIS